MSSHPPFGPPSKLSDDELRERIRTLKSMRDRHIREGNHADAAIYADPIKEDEDEARQRGLI